MIELLELLKPKRRNRINLWPYSCDEDYEVFEVASVINTRDRVLRYRLAVVTHQPTNSSALLLFRKRGTTVTRVGNEITTPNNVRKRGWDRPFAWCNPTQWKNLEHIRIYLSSAGFDDGVVETIVDSMFR